MLEQDTSKLLNLDLTSLTDDEINSYIELCDAKYIEYKLLQEALKVICNGLYGCLGSPYFRFFNLKIAESITITGHSIIENSCESVNLYMNKLLKTDGKDFVLAMDTDSNYIDFSDLVARIAPDRSDEVIVNFLDTISKVKIQPMLANSFDIFSKKTNYYESRLFMKRESICKAIFLEKKKRYILKVFDNEGVRLAIPEVKIVGLESVRSDIPEWCRKRLKQCFTMLFECNQEQMQTFIADTETEFFQLNVSKIAKPTSITDIVKYTDNVGMPVKGATAAAKGSINYNNLLIKHKLQSQFSQISNGDKIRLLPLKMPNPSNMEIIAFKEKIPVEFGIEKYVNMNILFEKNFIDPISRVLTVMGWSAIKKYNIGDFFC